MINLSTEPQTIENGDKAETTTGSIYSRFRDKEGLFGALVEPAAGGRTLEILNESDYEYSLNGNKQTNN